VRSRFMAMRLSSIFYVWPSARHLGPLKPTATWAASAQSSRVPNLVWRPAMPSQDTDERRATSPGHHRPRQRYSSNRGSTDCSTRRSAGLVSGRWVHPRNSPPVLPKSWIGRTPRMNLKPSFLRASRANVATLRAMAFRQM
jgi:hypothetical protein